MRLLGARRAPRACHLRPLGGGGAKNGRLVVSARTVACTFHQGGGKRGAAGAGRAGRQASNSRVPMTNAVVGIVPFRDSGRYSTYPNPQGDQAREVVGNPVAIGQRLVNALAFSGKTEIAVLLEVPEILEAELLQDEEAEAKVEAERMRSGPTMFTNGSWLCGSMEERTILGGPHGAQPGGLRRLVCCPC